MPRPTDLPRFHPGVGRFSDDGVSKRETVRRVLRENPRYLDHLLAGTARGRGGGRPRLDGQWALMYLDFCCTKEINVHPWWKETRESDWTDAGFDAKPPYRTVQRRLAELAAVIEAFEETTGLVIAHANERVGGWIGFDLSIDATERETNARLHHDCADHEACARRARREARQRGEQTTGRVPAEHPERETLQRVHDERHELNEQPVDDDTDTTPVIGEAELIEEIERDGAEMLRIKVGGCWFLCRDVEAGVRAYTGERGAYRFWTGFYGHKAIAHYTGLRLAELVGSASEQEYHAYPRLLQKVLRARGGEVPRAVCGDKGLSISSVFELNTRKGIRSVFPWRRQRHTTEREQVNCERYDQYGIPRCQTCLGPTRFVRFGMTGDRPRLWYVCERPGPDCPTGERTISCEEDWTMLLPLWRTNETYLALRTGHMEYERVHNLQRVRNNDGGDHHINRPRKVGIGWQQLRASASILIDWLLAAERNGWLGAPSRNDRPIIVRDAEENVRRLHRMREERNLHLTGDRYPGHGRRHRHICRRARAADSNPPDPGDPATTAPELTDDL